MGKKICVEINILTLRQCIGADTDVLPNFWRQIFPTKDFYIFRQDQNYFFSSKLKKCMHFSLTPKALIHDPPTHFSLTCRAYFSALKNNITLFFSLKNQISYNIYNLLYLKVILCCNFWISSNTFFFLIKFCPLNYHTLSAQYLPG